MGLCLSKRDVLIQKPLRDHHILGNDFHLRGLSLVPDSPSISSMISGDTSSVAEIKHLLKNRSVGSSCPTIMRSSISNIAECGSQSSISDWRNFNRASIRKLEIDDLDEDSVSCSSNCGRTSGFSYISSPTVEGIDLESFSRSYQRARMERFEMEGFNPLLEIDEEHEFDLEGDELVPTGTLRKKTTQPKSLHVFGDVFNNKPPPAIPAVVKKKSELGVFGADSKPTAAEIIQPPLRSVMRSEPPRVPVFKQPQFDSDFGETESEHVHPNGRSARWGFVVDSLGTDEMEADDSITEVSRVSSSSTNFESLCRSSMSSSNSSFRPATFVPRKMDSYSWQQQQPPSTFSAHMNPNSKSSVRRATEEPNSMGFPQSFRSAEFVQGSTSSRSSDSSVSSSSKPKIVKQVHINSASSSGRVLNSKPSEFDSDSDDDGNESDSSNDLFEIENLGAALGSLSTFSGSDKEFMYPVMNNSFLRDPDISFTTTQTPTKISASAPAPQGAKSSFQFQNGFTKESSGKILGPTQRANVLQSTKQQKPDSQRKSFPRPVKKKSAVENESSILFYGR